MHRMGKDSCDGMNAGLEQRQCFGLSGMTGKPAMGRSYYETRVKIKVSGHGGVRDAERWCVCRMKRGCRQWNIGNTLYT